MKYRKKQIEVEAHYVSNRSEYDQKPTQFDNYTCFVESYPYDFIICDTASGEIEAKLPTWLILESDGKGCYPCSSEMFEKLYEKV